MTLEKCAWSDKAARFLADALGDDARVIGLEVKEGGAELWQHKDGYTVTRIEEDELVLVAAQGRNLDKHLAHWLQVAERNKLKAVRLHSARAGMGKMIAKHGFVEVERIYKAVVNGR